MAILDTSKKPYIHDRDERVSIGIDFPFRKSDGKEGYFASTKTTIEAVKNNIRNLINTEKGERLFQPNIGLNLKKYLFNPMDEDTIITIQNEINSTVKFWLPFVNIRNIIINRQNNLNKINIKIDFIISIDPNTLQSVELSISENSGVNEEGQLSGNNYMIDNDTMLPGK